MLRELIISNFKLLRDVTLIFEPGMTVLTGETGAGKTQCLEALKFALGTRSGDETVSKDAEGAVVSVSFDLGGRPDIVAKLESEGWIDSTEPELILERSIERGGQSKGRLNGRRVPIGTLQEVADRVVDILGQHARADLLNRPALELLDSMGDSAHQGMAAKVREHYASWHECRSAYDQEVQSIELAKQHRELVEFQHTELDKAGLKIGEEVELTKELEFLESARERISGASAAAMILENDEADRPSARSMLQSALDHLERLADHDQNLNQELLRLRDALFYSEELADTLRKYSEDIVDDPNQRNNIENRLGVIHQLKRKYRTDETGLISLRDRLRLDLEKVENAAERLSELKKTTDEAKVKFLDGARKLSKSRSKLAKYLEKAVKEQLADLDLGSARIEVKIATVDENDDDKYRADGIDRAELLISTNPSQDMMPLRKAASGGELSRLLIALKSVLAERDRIPVLIFDEAEAGIGGETGFRVGEKLAELASSHQLVIVSHLPQVASHGNCHFVVEKITDKSGTRATARKLEGESRVEEIERMLGARGDKAALRKLARSFLDGVNA